MIRRWLPSILSLGVAVLIAWALPLLGVPDNWRWPILGVGLGVAILIAFAKWRARTHVSLSRDTAKLLRVVLKLEASGKALLKELRGIVTLSPEQYRIRRQEVIDWVTIAHERLSKLDPVQAERFGDPSEAQELDLYAPVSAPSYALRPLIDHVRERIARLKTMRAPR